jgi:hypothetical protein
VPALRSTEDDSRAAPSLREINRLPHVQEEQDEPGGETMNLRKAKTFDVEGRTVTVDASDFARVRPLISRMRAVEQGKHLIFLVNHGTKDRPAYQTLASFILNRDVYVTVKDGSGDHRRSNLAVR